MAPAFPINGSKQGFARMNVSFNLPLTTVALSAAFLCLAPMIEPASAVERSETTTLRTVGNIRLAQSGSMGGTIGNREKALSGSREVAPERPARHSKPRRSQREAPARRSSGGGNFDGIWTVVSRGCSGAGTGSITVSGGRIIGQGVSGSISPGGAIRSVANLRNGGVSIGSGRASGHTASGSYRQSDGCTGRFTAIRN
jgi:hypothetical protein